LGGNLGDVGATLLAARSALAQLPQTVLMACSSLYQTAAIGPGVQADYLNAAVVVATDLPADRLLQQMHVIEAQFGRERSERWGARTLDLDLLAYGDCCCDDDHLQLPHPRMAERLFVLLPLLEVASDWMHPRLGLSVAQMASALRASPPVARVVRLDNTAGGW